MAGADQVKVHVPGNDLTSMSTVHHVIGQRVGCVDCKEGQVVMALTEMDYNAGIAQGGNHKVRDIFHGSYVLYFLMDKCMLYEYLWTYYHLHLNVWYIY